MRYDGRDDGKTLGKMNSWLIIGVLALYIVLLFICAFFGEKHASRLSTRGRMLLFSLTLGVYCSSWTFYGATGAAVREGIIFLPIYLGPLLFVALGYDIWRRLAASVSTMLFHRLPILSLHAMVKVGLWPQW